MNENDLNAEESGIKGGLLSESKYKGLPARAKKVPPKRDSTRVGTLDPGATLEKVADYLVLKILITPSFSLLTTNKLRPRLLSLGLMNSRPSGASPLARSLM